MKRMKKMKKIISLLAAVVMVFTMTFSAAATETGGTPPAPAAGTTAKVTIKCPEGGHVFNAYQIFQGNVDSTGTTMSDIEWAGGVAQGTELINDIQNITLADGVTKPFAGCTTAPSIAEVLSKANDNSETVQKFADAVKKYKSDVKTTSNHDPNANTYTIEGLTAGYYMILDEPTTGSDITPSAIIVHLIGKDIEIDAKVDVATVSKNTYPDFYSVGDEAPYKLRGTLPGSFNATTTGGNEYKYSFVDTFDKELQPASDWEFSNADPAADGTKTLNKGVKVELQNGENTTDVTNNFTSTWNENDHVLKVRCADLRGVADVDKDSAIVVTYKAKVNEKPANAPGINNKVTLYYGDKHTKEADETVFTLELVVKSVDGADNTKALNGAEFVLSRVVNNEGAATTEYLKITKSEGKPDELSWVEDQKDATTLKTEGEEGEGENKKALGKFNVTGLTTGTYTLTETKAPEGYNKLDKDVKVEISGTAQRNSSGKKVLVSLGITANGEAGEVEKIDEAYTGTVSITIANNKGSVLPSTGGMGLTIIYAVGAILLVGAGILLVTRRRMKAK